MQHINRYTYASPVYTCLGAYRNECPSICIRNPRSPGRLPALMSGGSRSQTSRELMRDVRAATADEISVWNAIAI